MLPLIPRHKLQICTKESVGSDRMRLSDSFPLSHLSRFALLQLVPTRSIGTAVNGGQTNRLAERWNQYPRQRSFSSSVSLCLVPKLRGTVTFESNHPIWVRPAQSFEQVHFCPICAVFSSLYLSSPVHRSDARHSPAVRAMRVGSGSLHSFLFLASLLLAVSLKPCEAINAQARVTGHEALEVVGGRSGGYAVEPADRRADRFEIAQEAGTPWSEIWTSTATLREQRRMTTLKADVEGGHQLDRARAAEMMKASWASEAALVVWLLAHFAETQQVKQFVE